MAEMLSDHRSAIARRACAFDALGAQAVVLNGDGVVVETNQAWRLFGRLGGAATDSIAAGVNYLDVCDRSAAAGDTSALAVAHGLRSILAGEHSRFDFEYPCPSPLEDRWYLMQAASAPVEDGAGLVVFHIDITARRRLQDRLRALADQDPLTGIANRRAGRHLIDDLLQTARRQGGSVTVLFIDLDGFKAVNDSLGHSAGDELLSQVTERATRFIRTGDVLCRFGGDEFVLAFPGLDSADADRVAQRVTKAMAVPFQIGSAEVKIGASVGLVMSEAGVTLDELLGTADHAMYQAKAAKAHTSARPGALRDVPSEPG